MAPRPARRAWRLLSAVVVPLLMAAVLAGCGSSATTASASTDPLKVTLTTANGTTNQVSAGDQPVYTVSVVDEGPGATQGVTVRVNLPQNFRYLDTISIGGGAGNEDARTASDDAQLNSPDPTWGLWSLPAPAMVDGTEVYGEVDITFTAVAGGQPGSYSLTSSALTDSDDGAANAAPLPVVLLPTPQLSLQLSASPARARAGDVVSYNVTVTNVGSGPATGVTVLVVIPSSFEYDRTLSIDGNSSRNGGNNPLPNGSLVDYGGFTVPARSAAGPGVLVIDFTAVVQQGAAAGDFPATAQLTDAAGTVIRVANTVPITVPPTATATPVPTFAFPTVGATPGI